MPRRTTELPRDLQLKVLQKLDMDGRVCLGIVGRLKVPKSLAEAITAGLRKRIPIPEWIFDLGPEQKQGYIEQTIALRMPISNGCNYERYYDGSWLLHSGQRMPSRLWMKFTAVIYEDERLSDAGLRERRSRLGFPDVQGLPADFVDANPQWVIDYPEDDWKLLCQPGSAFRRLVPATLP